MKSSTFDFLKLPPELRDKVYEEIVIQTLQNTNDHRMVKLSDQYLNDGTQQETQARRPIHRSYVLLHGESPLVTDPASANRLAQHNPHRTTTNLLASSQQIKNEVEFILRLYQATDDPLVEFKDFTKSDMSSWVIRFGDKHLPKEFAINSFLPCVETDRDSSQPMFHHFCIAFDFRQWKDAFVRVPVRSGPMLEGAFYTISRLDITRAQEAHRANRFCRFCHSRLRSVIDLTLRDSFWQWQRQRKVDLTSELLLKLHMGIVKQVAENRNTRAQWMKYLETISQVGGPEG